MNTSPFLSLRLALVLLLCGVARAAEPPAMPILRIETGMHTSVIYSMDVDAQEQYVATASSDKTLRVWELASGRLIQTLRLPIGGNEGVDGSLYSAAISPDGLYVACSGVTGAQWDGTCSIYIFERASGRMARRISGLPTAANICYSRDGRFLVAWMSGKFGLRFYHAADGTPAGQDTQYGGNIHHVDFDAAGHMVTTSADGFIFLYDANFKLLKKRPMPGSGKPFFARFSPDGTKIAVGFVDSTRVNVLSARDLSLLYEPDTRGVTNGDLSKVAWSQDGQYLYAAGWWSNGRIHPIRRWSKGGRGDVRDFLPEATNVIVDLHALRNGGLLFGTADPAWGVMQATGRVSPFNKPTILNYQDLPFSAAPDGSAVQIQRDTAFSILKRSLYAHDSNGDGWQVPKLLSNAHGVQPGMQVVEVSPNGGRLAFGGYALYRFDGVQYQPWPTSLPGWVYAVNVVDSGRLCLVAFGDGTIRWYRMSDGKELLALFVHADHKRWVLWTPAGFYDASPGGEDLIGWHLNHGRDHAADFFPASRLRDLFYRPDIIQRVLQTLDELKAIKAADAARGDQGPLAQAPDIETVRAFLQQETVKRVPPVVHITSPTDGVETQATTLTVRYTLRTPSGEPVTSVRALVDGQPVGDKQFLNVTAPDEVTREIQVPIPAHPCEVALVAENLFASSEPARVRVGGLRGSRLALPDPVQQALQSHARLLAVMIGISTYAHPNNEFGNLRYADKDAASFADILKGQQGVFYQSVQVRLLTNEAASRDNIVDALGWLKKTAQPGDTVFIFYAGHGDSDADGYFLLPYNYDAGHDSTALFDAELLGSVGAIASRARTVVFLDSCRSGGVTGERADITGLINKLANPQKGAPGVVVFSAAAASQLAEEDARWGGGHGAFTYVLLQALQGKAADDKGDIWYKDLDTYLSKQVRALTSQSQEAVSSQFGVPDFTLAHSNRPPAPGGKP